jgi:L-asparagine transporter-like permease
MKTYEKNHCTSLKKEKKMAFSLLNIAFVLFFFTLLFLMFGFSQVDKKIALWIIIAIIITFVLGWATRTTGDLPEEHPTFQLIH